MHPRSTDGGSADSGNADSGSEGGVGADKPRAAGRIAPLDPALVAPGVRTRFVDNGNGLSMHLLEAGWEDPARPCVLLLHGFPELAYSWRAVIGPLAQAGYHVVAPDQRGYGRTAGGSSDYDVDLAPYRMLNLARDALGLVHALGRSQVHAVVGHDFGSPVAAWCATVRPDVFRSVALMSAPFGGPPALPPPGRPADAALGATAAVLQALAQLPRPRKHYQWYYSERRANRDMLDAPQGLHAFLRAYYHVKSADWPQNLPQPLQAWNATELARLPEYYVMDLDQDMAQTVAPHMPDAAQIAGCRWLTDAQLAIYVQEFARTGFQPALNWYRGRSGGQFLAEEQLFAGRTIDVPACFIAGRSDWGSYQKPGELQRMGSRAFTRMGEPQLIAGAGHWVQQEQPQQVVSLLLRFLAGELPAS